MVMCICWFWAGDSAEKVLHAFAPLPMELDFDVAKFQLWVWDKQWTSSWLLQVTVVHLDKHSASCMIEENITLQFITIFRLGIFSQYEWHYNLAIFLSFPSRLSSVVIYLAPIKQLLTLLYLLCICQLISESRIPRAARPSSSFNFWVTILWLKPKQMKRKQLAIK